MSLFEGGMDELDLVTTLFRVVVLLGVVYLPILKKNDDYLAQSVYKTGKYKSIHMRCIYRVQCSKDLIGKVIKIIGRQDSTVGVTVVPIKFKINLRTKTRR